MIRGSLKARADVFACNLLKAAVYYPQFRKGRMCEVNVALGYSNLEHGGAGVHKKACKGVGVDVVEGL